MKIGYNKKWRIMALFVFGGNLILFHEQPMVFILSILPFSANTP